MIRYLIKNNFKLMMRSATNILLYIVTPVILVALLSSAFSNLLEKYEANGSIKAGYSIKADDTDVKAELLTEQVKTAANENDIILIEYPECDVEKKIMEEDLAGFVVFEKDGKYTIYQNGERKYEAKALDYLIGSVDQRIAQFMLDAYRSDTPPEAEIAIEHPQYMAPIEASDYYGIVEVVYFGWCAVVCGAGIFTAEKKYHIGKKLKVSGLSELQLFLGKFIPMLLVVSISSLLTAGITILLFGVHWGSPLISALIVVVSAAAATAFGLMFYNITGNVVVTIIAVFAVVWVAGFTGGSFETYMLSTQPQVLKDISPIYHINRALTELSCMGRSDYTLSAITYCIMIMLVSAFAAVAAGYIRGRKGE
ncbi:MAG: ABC transporter permease [Lachnospiraceae bacterium]|nr:ABC transporter permease [Lachnospiraceae bacterium]